MSLPDLQILKPDQRSMITDIVFMEPDTINNATDLSLARAYIGGRDPVWLADPRAQSSEDMEQLVWLHDFYCGLREAHPDNNYFRYTFGDHTFRAKRRMKGNGQRRLTLRSIPKVSPELEDLQMPPYVADLLTSLPLKRRGGLVLVVAPVGQGKSTTLAAAIKSRLRIHGGQTLTIEHPMEHFLDGFHGTGECIQTEISNEPGAWAHAIRESLGDFSVFPGGGATLFVGEIRDGETAAEALRAAQAGYLVFATLHAQSTINTVFRLISLASDVLGPKDAADTVASALRLVIYQTLTLIPRPIGWKRGSLAADVLFNAGASSAIANVIRDTTRSIDNLNEPLEKQKISMQRGSERNASFAEVYADLGGDPNELA